MFKAPYSTQFFQSEGLQYYWKLRVEMWVPVPALPLNGSKVLLLAQLIATFTEGLVYATHDATGSAHMSSFHLCYIPSEGRTE